MRDVSKMSEKKASEILLEKLEAFRKEMIAEIKSSKTSTPEHEHVAMPESAKGHKTIDEVADCPNCRPRLIEKLRPEIEKELKEKHKSLKEPTICKGCGEIVEKTAEECPSCHGRKATEVT